MNYDIFTWPGHSTKAKRRTDDPQRYTNNTSSIKVNDLKKIMNDKNIPFQTIDWAKIPKTEHKGETGIAYWQTLQFDGLRIRIVEYSAGYMADHWCAKGHIVHCLMGEVVNEQKDGTSSVWKNINFP